MSAMVSQPLFIRADASTQIGTGHVMRCLALAQTWQDAGGQAHFAAAELPDGLAARLAAEGMTLHRLDVAPGSPDDAAQTAALAQRLGASWVVEDGYHFGTDYQHAVKEAGLRLLAIDDYGHADHYVADLVLNQNISADASLYASREPATQLLLGTDYTLLRREFKRWRGWQRMIPDVARNVLVTMGGSDPNNVTDKVIEALAQAPADEMEAIIVVGSSNPQQQTLTESIERSGVPLRLLHDVADMPELMAWADLAITAGGSTCWELAFMGTPGIILVLAANQAESSRLLGDRQVFVNLGDSELLSAEDIRGAWRSLSASREMRQALSQECIGLVDGQGVGRVANYLIRDNGDEHDQPAQYSS